MFENFNKKIKILAEVIAIAGCVLSFLYLISIYINVNNTLKTKFDALFYSGFGILASLVSSFTLYGFGELVSSISEIRNRIRLNQMVSDSNERNDSDQNDRKNSNQLNNDKTADNVNDGSNN